MFLNSEHKDALARVWAKVDKRATKTALALKRRDVTIAFDKGAPGRKPYVVVSVRNNPRLFREFEAYCKEQGRYTQSREIPEKKGGTIYC